MADGGSIVLRLSVKGAREVRAALESLGPVGRRMGDQIDNGLRAPNAGMRALSAGMGNLTGQAAGMTTRLGAAGSALAAMGPIGIGVGAAIAAVGLAASIAGPKVAEALDWAGNLNDTSKALHVSAVALQEWRFAAEEAGLEATAFDSAITGLDSALGRAQRGQIKYKAMFKDLGLSAETVNNARSAADILPQVADGLARIGSEAQRAAIADRLGIRELLPLLEQGSARIDAFRERARALGLVIDNETAESMAKLDREAKVAAQAIDINLKQAFLSMAPTFVWFTNEIAKLTRGLSDLMDQFKRAEDRSSRFNQNRRRELEAQGRGMIDDYGVDQLTGTGTMRSRSGLRYQSSDDARAQWRAINAEIDQLDELQRQRDAANTASGTSTPADRYTPTAAPGRPATPDKPERLTDVETISAADKLGMEKLVEIRMSTIAEYMRSHPGETGADMNWTEIDAAIQRRIVEAIDNQQIGIGGEPLDVDQNQQFENVGRAMGDGMADSIAEDRDVYVSNFTSWWSQALRAAASNDMGEFWKQWALNWLGQALEQSLYRAGQAAYDMGGSGNPLAALGDLFSSSGLSIGGFNFSAGSGGGSAHMGSNYGYAQGTQYSGQGVFDVGERGRERIWLPRGSVVKNQSQLGAGPSMALSFPTSIYAPNADAGQLAAIRGELRDYKRGEAERFSQAILALKKVGILT